MTQARPRQLGTLHARHMSPSIHAVMYHDIHARQKGVMLLLQQSAHVHKQMMVGQQKVLFLHSCKALRGHQVQLHQRQCNRPWQAANRQQRMPSHLSLGRLCRAATRGACMPARQSTNASACRVEAQGKVVLPSCSFGGSRCGQSSLAMYMTTVTTSGHLQAAVHNQQQSHWGC